MPTANNVAPISAATANKNMLERFMELVDNFDYDNPPPPPVFTVGGLVPAGKVTMFPAEGAAGKTQALLDLAQKIAYPNMSIGDVADTWLGSPVKETGHVIFVSAEETREDFHSRLADLGCGYRKGPTSDHRIHLLDKMLMAQQPLFTLKGDNVVPTEAFRTLREMARILWPKLIVIDTLNSLCPVNIDSNTAHGQACMQMLGVIAAESGAALVVTHHINKTGEITSRSSARKAIKGTTGTVDGARNVLVIWQCPEKKAQAAVAAGICEDEADLFCAAVVKSNVKGADTKERYFTRDMRQGGVMREVLNMPEPEPEQPKTAAAKRGRGRPKKGA